MTASAQRDFAPSAHEVDRLDGAPVVKAHDARQWEAWLADHHQEPAGAWLMIAKKNTGATTVSQPEALDGALCFGWIDSVRRSLDATYYLQRYSRRRRGSAWSTINGNRAEALAAARSEEHTSELQSRRDLVCR